MFKFSKNSENNRSGVSDNLIKVGDLALSISPIDFGYSSGLRTDEEQHVMFLDGHSMLDGYNKKSKHQADETGNAKALDFYAFVNGKVSYKTEHLNVVVAAHLQAASLLGVKLKSGMFFKPFKRHNGNDFKSGWDYPHIEEAE